MFSDAVDNDIINKNPVTKAVKYNIGKEPKKVRALTIDEQKKFLETAMNSSNYNQYAFLLQTGLRTGELIGLKSRKGEPTKNSAYDTTLFKLCDKAGMRPKTLQIILGHSNVGNTMNLYVHVTDDEKIKEVERIEKALKIV